MKKLILFLVSFFTIATLFVGTGCKTQYVPVPVETKTDSVFVVQVIDHYDTVTINLPSETLYVVKQDSSHLETSLALSDAVIDSTGLLHHSLINKKGSLSQQVVHRDTIINITKVVEKEVPVIKEVETIKEVVPSYYRTINTIFWIVVSLIILYIVIRVLVAVYFHK